MEMFVIPRQSYIQFIGFFFDLIMASSTLHIRWHRGHVNELQHVWFCFDDSQRNVYYLNAFI